MAAAGTTLPAAGKMAKKTAIRGTKARGSAAGTGGVKGQSSLLQRYLDGDRERVWHELRQLGGHVRDPDLIEQAEPVVREAMSRAGRNVQTLIERLRGQGYRFGDPWNEDGARKPHAPPDEHTPAFVSWLEKRFGHLAMTARTWIEVVGDVSLLGVHPDWPKNLVSDPLVVEFEYKSWRWAEKNRLAARDHFEGEHESWADSRRDGHDFVGAFTLDVAPDALHKANISGGAPYGVIVPDASVDATFRYDDGVLVPFVEYLRLAFRNGGFPGTWRRDCGRTVEASRRALAEGLLEI